jgi:ABC-type branched-subunit amino acid transport system substrate-binding protein
MGRRASLVAAALGVVLAACATTPPERAPVPAVEEVRPTEEPAREAVLRLGVVVSRTGSSVLERYAELVLEGAQLAVQHESTAQRRVELVIRDDGGTAAGAARAMRELEQAGVQAVIGPLVEDALAAAAGARVNDGLLIISPTAVADPRGVRNVYALNVIDTGGSTALGGYARRFARVGVLYSRTPEGTRQARAFMDAYSQGGQGTVRDVGFDPGTTNMSAPLARLREARVQAVFFPGSDRELQIVLPQIEFYGLSGVQLLGTENWISDAARTLPQRALQGAVVAIPLWRESADLAWRDFVSAYETKHRRSLENPIPALGFDATVLAVRALTSGGTAVSDFRGATGRITLQGDTVSRRPFLVRIESGRLIPVN